MAITLAADVASVRAGGTVTITVAGGVAATAYTITHGSTKVARHDFTTDGSGAATVKCPHDGAAGTITYSIRPTAEFNGTTTAAATCTANAIA